MTQPAARVPPDLGGERLDRVIAVLGAVSRAQARSMIESGDVAVGEVVVRSPAARVEAGVQVGWSPPPDPLPLLSEEVDFSVAWEDEHLAVINKPAGIITHPGAGNATGTLAAGIIHRWPHVEGVGDAGRWGIVHRLDKGTSGLLAIAKTDQALESLRTLIRERRVARRYLALVQQPMSIETGTVDAPIDRDPNRPMRRRVHPMGRPSRTHYEQLAAWTEHGLLTVTLETGRTHQIRVHLSAIDHPVVGDRTYGAARRDPADPGRLWLHSWTLEFAHPLTGETVFCRAELPEDLAASLRGLSDPVGGAVPPEAFLAAP